MAIWLCSMCEDYSIEVVENKIIKHIRLDILDAIAKGNYNAIKNHSKLKDGINKNCIICCENKKTYIWISRSHDFCVECICKWRYLHDNKTCPICRK